GGRTRMDRAWRFGLTASLHLVQPLARLAGRIQHGLVPWRRRGPDRRRWRFRARTAGWRGTGKPPEGRLEEMLRPLRGSGVGGGRGRGGEWDDGALAPRGGFMGGARFRIMAEEHGRGRQMLRTLAWVRIPAGAVVLTAALGALGAAALAGGAIAVSAVLLTAAA